MPLQLQRPDAEARERAGDDLVELFNLLLRWVVSDIDVELWLWHDLKV